MRMLAEEPEAERQLREQLALIDGAPQEYAIAVECLLFNEDLDWILVHRGGGARDEVGKLEGIGGRFEKEDPDFRSALLREVLEEVGSDARVEIVDFLEVKWDVVVKLRDGQTYSKNWIIVSYLCRHLDGELHIMEPEKCIEFVKIKNLNVNPDRLSSSTQISLRTLSNDWGRYKAKLVSR